jgi:capsular polysaccharide biosynthesis protein
MQSDDDEQDGSGANQIELIKSYFAFARRAVGKRRSLTAAIFAVVVVLVSVGLAIWPRSYQSELRMMVQRSSVLDTDDRAANPLQGASDVVTRYENLEALVKQLELAKTWSASRPPALALKDRVLEAFRGTPSEKDFNDALVTMLEGRLWASAEDQNLTIGASWSDPETARRIVEAAKESFLQSRHAAEISVIQEKMSILEGHSTRLRGEIEGIAQELGRVKEEKLAAAEKAARKVSEAAAGTPAPAPRVAMPRRSEPSPAASSPPVTEADLATLKEDLETKKRKLSELQGRRQQSQLEAKGRLVDLKLKFTDDHPEVRSAEQRVALLGQVPIEESTLSGEVEALQARVKQVTAAARLDAAAAAAPVRPGGTTAASPTPNDTLPSEILRLLDDSNEMDPAISAQLSTALSKYSEIRGEIRSARINLDTAQAAFNHRYKIVVPASLPLKPSKPKVPLVLGVGFLVALALALIVPIVLELKNGIIVERWQVHQIPIPVLGELHLPPRDQ